MKTEENIRAIEQIKLDLEYERMALTIFREDLTMRKEKLPSYTAYKKALEQFSVAKIKLQNALSNDSGIVIAEDNVSGAKERIKHLKRLLLQRKSEHGESSNLPGSGQDV